MVAGLLLVRRDLCWEEFLKLEHPEREWALKTLAKYVRDGDGAPDVLRKLRDAEEKAKEKP